MGLDIDIIDNTDDIPLRIEKAHEILEKYSSEQPYIKGFAEKYYDRIEQYIDDIGHNKIFHKRWYLDKIKSYDKQKSKKNKWDNWEKSLIASNKKEYLKAIELCSNPLEILFHSNPLPFYVNEETTSYNEKKSYEDNESYYNAEHLRGELLKLHLLLQNKGFDINYHDLGLLLHFQFLNAGAKQLWDKLKSYNPSTFDDYIDAFLEYYGESYLRKTTPFIVLLSSKGLPCDDEIVILALMNKHDEDDLKQLEKSLLSRNKTVNMSEIDALSGHEFERFLGRLFDKMGYKVTITPKSGDYGADLILEKHGEKTAVQAKKWGGNIGIEAIQQVVTSKKFYDCDKAMVVGTSIYSKNAEELAFRNKIELVDRDKLQRLIEKYM